MIALHDICMQLQPSACEGLRSIAQTTLTNHHTVFASQLARNFAKVLDKIGWPREVDPAKVDAADWVRNF